MTSKKPSWVEIVEKEIRRLDERMNRMGDNLTSLIVIIAEENELASRLRFSSVVSDSLSTDDVINNIIKLFEDEHALVKRFKSHKELYEVVFDGLKKRMPLYIGLAKKKHIAFNDFAALIIKKLGLDLARQVVPLDALIRYFGVQSADAWKKLLKK